MRKTLIIAKREYQAMVRTKAFIVSLVLMPIFMGGGILAQKALRGRVDVSDKRIVVLDATGRLLGPLSEAAERYNRDEIFDEETGKQTSSRCLFLPGPAVPVTDEVRAELSQQAKRGEVFGFLDIPEDVLDPRRGRSEVRFHGQGAAFSDIRRWLSRTVNDVVQLLRFTDVGIDPKIVRTATAPVIVESLGLYERTASGEIRKAEKSQRELAFFVPLGVLMLMFMAVMIVAQPLLQSVLEEKQQRIAEVMLGSASPFQIMMGKLVGNVGVSLTVVGVYALGGLATARHYDVMHLMPTELAVWFIVYQILACLLFGSAFIAVGAACNEIKDAQNLMTPIMLILVVPLMLWFNVLREPLSKFATWISLFPPATPMLMLVRLSASSAVPLWQPLLGVGLVLLATVCCVFAAGRVFRIGILSQGKTPRLRELFRWIATG